MSSDDLVPCPFCGGKADFEETEGPSVDTKSWTVGCEERTDAGAVLCYGYQSLTTFATKREAAAAWNRRVSPKPPPEPEIAELVKRLRDLSMSREDCGRAADALECLAKSLADNDAEIKRKIDYRLEAALVDMKEGYDDSVTGLNDAWRIIDKVFAERNAARQRQAKETTGE